MIADDAETRDLYALAFTLGLTIGQVRDLPVEEVRGWVAFLEWRAKEQRQKRRG